MGWLRLVGSLKLQVSFAKERYKRDDILQKRLVILRSLLIGTTTYPADISEFTLALLLKNSNSLRRFEKVNGLFATPSRKTQLTHLVSVREWCMCAFRLVNYCNTLRHTATHCSTIRYYWLILSVRVSDLYARVDLLTTATHCNTLQHSSLPLTHLVSVCEWYVCACRLVDVYKRECENVNTQHSFSKHQLSTKYAM